MNSINKRASCKAGSHPHTNLALRVSVIRIHSKGTPTSVGRKASADSVVPALRTMGTLEGPRTDLKFDGTAKGWLAFKQQMLKFLLYYS